MGDLSLECCCLFGAIALLGGAFCVAVVLKAAQGAGLLERKDWLE